MIGFNRYTVEAQFDGTTWTALNTDIITDISFSYGIMASNAPIRVADIGKLSFDLNNTETNTAGLVGYYSPGHPNCRAGFAPGLPIRLTFTLDYKIVKWTGWIPVDGIKVQTGRYSARHTSVQAVDWMYHASIHQLTEVEYLENATIADGVAEILTHMPIQPPGTVRYYDCESTMVSLFDLTRGQTTALSEFGKFANSELGYIYLTRHGLVVEGRLTRNDNKMYPSEYPIAKNQLGLLINEDGDYIVNEDGDRILLSDSKVAEFDNAQIEADVSYGTHYANQVRFTCYPRKIDAAATTVLFQIERPIEILAGETIIMEGRYSDPNGVYRNVSGIDMVTPTATNYWLAYENSDGSGTEYTSDITVTPTWGIDKFTYEITNTAASDCYITMLKAVGRGVYTDDAVSYFTQNDSAVAAYGGHLISVDMKYQQDIAVMRQYARVTLFQYSTLQSYLNSVEYVANRYEEMLYAFLYLEPGDKVTIKEEVTGIDTEYFIQGIEGTIQRGGLLRFSWILKAAHLDTFYITLWDTEGTWNDGTYGWDF